MFVFFDACHMLKLVRNFFAEKVIKNSKDNIINYEYINVLMKYQYESGVYFANKLKIVIRAGLRR